MPYIVCTLCKENQHLFYVNHAIKLFENCVNFFLAKSKWETYINEKDI